jgi:hypothetical protein
MRKLGKNATITAALFVLTLGAGVFAACDNNGSTEQSTDEDAYLVSWTAARGFIMDGTSVNELTGVANHVRTVVKDAPEGRGTELILWAIGDGISMPFLTLPAELPQNQVFPNIVVPETLASGTKLKIWSTFEGKLDKFVADATVEQELYSYETPYATYTVTRNRCYDYCDVGSCTCGFCNVCGGASCSQTTLWKGWVNNPCPYNSCNSGCGDTGNHNCWGWTRRVVCN